MAKKSKGKKALKIILIALAALIVAVIVAIACLWGNEIATLASLKQVRARDDSHKDGSVYQMQVRGGLYFDDFLAQGGATNDADLISFITGNITKGLISMGLKESDINCSAFTAYTPEGDRLFGRNYDFDKTNTCIVYTNPGNGRHASYSTVDLQFLGIDQNSDVNGLMDKVTCLAAPFAPLDGVNDAGVSCGIFMSYQGTPDADGEMQVVSTNQNTDKPDLTSTTMLRLVLDYAATVDEAVDLISGYDLHDSANTSFHYMIADATGRSAILEWVAADSATDGDGAARTLVVTYNDDDAALGEREAAADFQWITNYILQPGYYVEGANQPGRDRYDRIYECLSATDGQVADEQAAMDILNEVSRRDWDADGEGCTVHSVVYNLTDKTMLWIPNEHYDDPDAVFAFSLDGPFAPIK